ncbi:hypothetical protein ACH47C_41790 [Streptomyces rishiriensis]
MRSDRFRRSAGDDYEGPTLRDHLGARDQYGLDPRVTETAR